MFDASVLDVLIHFHSSRATIARTRLMRKMSNCTHLRHSPAWVMAVIHCVYAKESIFIANIYIYLL